MIEINANDSQRKYHKIIKLPYDADINTARSPYKNGILEMTPAKRLGSRAKGKDQD